MDNSDGWIALLVLALFALSVLTTIGGLVLAIWLERRHFQSIRDREAGFHDYPAVPTRSWDTGVEVADARLVTASVVVSLSHFKRFMVRFRQIFGGRIRSYENLLERGKREAILRLKEQTPDHHIIVNLRLLTSNIASIHDPRQKGASGVEVLASGTAVQYRSATSGGTIPG